MLATVFDGKWTPMVISVIALLVTSVLVSMATMGIRNFGNAKGFRAHRITFISKVIRITSILLVSLFLIQVWSFDFKVLWVSITGILGILAVGLFAFWSLLSNIVAGVFLFLTDPFRIEDEVGIQVDRMVQGKVLDIGFLFVTLQCQEGRLERIPNNLFFQKPVQIFRKESDLKS